ncbi:MAG: GNAT family N-acetyltransferase, partial [Verrucomicrobiales bacterium]
PDQQRRGFATQIMAEAVCFLDQSGCPKINLQVRAMNTQVIAFYESLGFSRDNVISLGKRLIPDH